MDFITYNTLMSYRMRRQPPCLQTGRAQALSAYEIAIKNGFKGSEQDWLNSLYPSIGENGNWFINGEDTGIAASGEGSWTKDYNDLINKPKLNGQILQGDVDLISLSPEQIDNYFNEGGS